MPAPARSVILGLVIVGGSALAGLALWPSAGHGGVLALLGAGFVTLLGWGAIPLVAGLFLGGLMRVAEGVLRRQLMRQLLPLLAITLVLLLLGWSRLLRGGHTGGLVGGWMAALLGLIPLRLGVVIAPVAAMLLACAALGVTWRHIAALTNRILSLATDATLRRAPDPLSGAAAPRTAAAADKHANSSSASQTPTARAGQRRAPPMAADGDAPALPSRERVTPDEQPTAATPAHRRARRDHDPLDATQLATFSAFDPTHLGSTARGESGPTTSRGDAAHAPFASTPDDALPREWVLPSPSLFAPAAQAPTVEEEREIEALAARLERTLRALRVEAEVRREDITIGPTVARFGIRPLERKQRDTAGRPELDADGEPLLVRTRVSRILALQPDLALALRVPSLRMEAPVPGQPYVGVEVPNPAARPVGLREVLWSDAARNAGKQRGLLLALGRDAAGHARVGDLTQFPHALIAGATGSGKSVCLHSIICSLIATYKPSDLRLLLIDPKLVELSIYDGVPHLLVPVITEVEAAEEALERALAEMRRRFALFSSLGVRNLDSYRRLRERQPERQPELESLPWIVIVVDEVANLMLGGDGRAEDLLCTLAQLARAAGIHLVIATQRPSVDVITGTIKANFPARLAFAMASSADSRTILDAGGAEHLLGRGDMLFVSGERARPERIQGCRVLDEEIERVVAHWTAQRQPTRQRDRTTFERSIRPSVAPRTGWPGHLDVDDTIEARQPGGQTRWGWDTSDGPAHCDEWR